MEKRKTRRRRVFLTEMEKRRLEGAASFYLGNAAAYGRADSEVGPYNEHLLRKQDGIHDVDDAVGLEDVGDGDARNAALFILDGDAVLAIGHDPELATGDSSELRRPWPALMAFCKSCAERRPATT